MEQRKGCSVGELLVLYLRVEKENPFDWIGMAPTDKARKPKEK